MHCSLRSMYQWEWQTLKEKYRVQDDGTALDSETKAQGRRRCSRRSRRRSCVLAGASVVLVALVGAAALVAVVVLLRRVPFSFPRADPRSPGQSPRRREEGDPGGETTAGASELGWLPEERPRGPGAAASSSTHAPPSVVPGSTASPKTSGGDGGRSARPGGAPREPSAGAAEGNRDGESTTGGTTPAGSSLPPPPPGGSDGGEDVRLRGQAIAGQSHGTREGGAPPVEGPSFWFPGGPDSIDYLQEDFRSPGAGNGTEVHSIQDLALFPGGAEGAPDPRLEVIDLRAPRPSPIEPPSEVILGPPWFSSLLTAPRLSPTRRALPGVSRDPQDPSAPAGVTGDLAGSGTLNEEPTGGWGDVEPPPGCSALDLDLCRGVLPYSRAVRAPASGPALRYLQLVAGSRCNPRARAFVCSLLRPPCPAPPRAGATPPCKQFCKAALHGCQELVALSSPLSESLNCENYPSSSDPEVCVNLGAGSACLEGEFPCSDGTCMPRKWWCDGTKDCPGGDDELMCSRCTEREFRCAADGHCVPLRWRCDRDRDCPDGSDEEDCGGGEVTSAPAGQTGGASAVDCGGPGKFRCLDGSRCLPEQRVCDGSLDCADGSDEPSNCTRPGCKLSEFRCEVSGRCIPEEWKCNGDLDCWDGSDEADCPPSPARSAAAVPRDAPEELLRKDVLRLRRPGPDRCPPGTLACPDRECIHPHQLCDGVAQCADGADELQCGAPT